MQEQRRRDFKGADEAEAKEDLVKVEDSLFATIAEDQDTMPMIFNTSVM